MDVKTVLTFDPSSEGAAVVETQVVLVAKVTFVIDYKYLRRMFLKSPM